MQSIPNLSRVPDDELLRRLAALLAGSRRTEADLVAHVGEVDARKLYAREATPSMFQYCTEGLHLSGAEAYLRIAAGRAAREHPIILTMLADGRLHLTAIALLAPHLTPQNEDVLLRRATHKSKREIEELLAEIAPRPDAPAMIRKLPERIAGRGLSQVSLASSPSPVPPTAPGRLRCEQTSRRRLRGSASRRRRPGTRRRPRRCPRTTRRRPLSCRNSVQTKLFRILRSEWLPGQE
jgi:hypothetical protein